jgi:nucleotide-binding universal stress UspA family protein
MKIIFATDFYAASVTARALLMKLTWSAETGLELLHVMTPPGRVGWFGRAEYAPEALEAARREIRSFGGDLAARVEAHGGSVQHALLIGDPANAIIQRALATWADLIVIGGPGRAESVSGELSLLSAALANRAHCSVLIARTQRVERLVITADAMGADELAERTGGWPLFRSIPVIASGSNGADGLERSAEFAISLDHARSTTKRDASARTVAVDDEPTEEMRAGFSKHDLVVVRAHRDGDDQFGVQQIPELTGFDGSVLVTRG